MAELMPRLENPWYSISATTRSPRPGEVDGKDYFFVTPERFTELVDSGQMLEWAIVHGNHRYGTPRNPVQDAIDAGKTAILELDLAGARQVRKSLPDAVQIFIAPPSFEDLVARLRGRGTEGEQEQARRLQTAREEIAAEGEFDYVVVNDEVARATAQILKIMAENS